MKKAISIILILILFIVKICFFSTALSKQPSKKLVYKPRIMKVGDKVFKGTDCFYINK